MRVRFRKLAYAALAAEASGGSSKTGGGSSGALTTFSSPRPRPGPGEMVRSCVLRLSGIVRTEPKPQAQGRCSSVHQDVDAVNLLPPIPEAGFSEKRESHPCRHTTGAGPQGGRCGDGLLEKRDSLKVCPLYLRRAEPPRIALSPTQATLFDARFPQVANSNRLGLCSPCHGSPRQRHHAWAEVEPRCLRLGVFVT